MRAASNGIEPPPQNVSASFRAMAKAGDAQLLDQFGDREGVGAEMPIHLQPNVGEQLRFVAFLGPTDVLETLVEGVRQRGESLCNPRLALVSRRDRRARHAAGPIPQ